MIERHGGTVDSLSGGSVTGIFGMEALHEDDALRATRAADELRDAGAGLGVDAGEVFIGTGARGAAFATGEAVAVAAALAGRAAPRRGAARRGRPPARRGGRHGGARRRRVAAAGARRARAARGQAAHDGVRRARA